MNKWNMWQARGREQQRRRQRGQRSGLRLESLESRVLMATDTLPVLMVIADQQDFYYREYGDTRQSIEAAGLDVVVAATSHAPSTPHYNTGEGSDGGVVVPDVALADVNSEDYSAIVFVGGWGSSMYQYSFPGDYSNDRYDGDLATKQVVNDLINEFMAEDKHVAAICHGVTVLAWARVDGVSPLAGREVSVPYIGSPPVFYNNTWYSYYQLGQYEQVVDNGGLANTFSGQYGDPTTVADDVVVDGRIITAENYDSALHFGEVIAAEVLAAASGGDESGSDDQPAEDEDPAPEDEPPADPAPEPGTAILSGSNILVQGTPAGDTIYLWSGAADNQVFAWINGQMFGPWALADGGQVIVHGDEGNDQIYATDMRVGVTIFGEGGHDQITGGSADDLLDGGEGWDRIWGGAGNDVLLGGAGNDWLLGREGNDVLLGGDGDDYLDGALGDDVMVGGWGQDWLSGGTGQDLLIGGTTDYDDDLAALDAIHSAWTANQDLPARVALLTSGLSNGVRLVAGQTVHGDSAADKLDSGAAADLVFAGLEDRRCLYELDDVLVGGA
ncbi:MAG: hypothetical protein J5I93_03750 [Pirellulaceae bacterium]|nr:hypothetical protein [Pirellulaceae bacterium]